MYDSFRRELATAKRNELKLSMIYFDVDKFKQINDKEGHIKGDEVLKKIGQILKANSREIDIPCRYGGDEFVVILPNCDTKNAKAICKKIIKDFSKKYPKYYLSFGISETGTSTYLDSDKLIKNADEKMYLSKQEDGFYIVEFITGRGFPVKHNGYLYCSKDIISENSRIRKRWPYISRYNNHWYRIRD